MRYGNTYKLNHKESGNKGSAELVLGDSTVLSAAGEGMPNLERSLLLSGGEPTGKSHAYSFQVRVLFHQCLCSRTIIGEAEETHLEGAEQGVFRFLPWAL